MPKTEPGSRAHTIVQVASALSLQLGRGAEVAELREAFEQTTGNQAPSSFTSEVHSLKKRGLLKVVGGRASHTLLAPAGFEPDRTQRKDDEVLLVLQALRSVYGRRGRPVSTREVEDEIDRLELPLDPNNANTVRQHLHTLCRQTTRGPRAARRPKARKITATGPSGQPTSHWAPANAEPKKKATAAARSKAAAIRIVVGRVQEALGRPATRTEVRWWLDGPGSQDDIGRTISSRHAGRRLSDTWSWDRKAEGQAGRLHQVSTALSCHGGAPVRWSLGPPGPNGERRCHLEDLVAVLRPADESESIRRLERRSAALRSDVLRGLADTRRGLLAAVLREPLLDADPEPVVVGLLEALQTARRWTSDHEAALTEGQIEVRLRDLDARVWQLEAAQAVLRFTPAGETPLLRIVGQGGTATWEELDEALRSTCRRLGLSPRRGPTLIERARRFPIEHAPGEERFGEADEHPLSVLDRPDVMATLYELFRLPRTSALMRDAHMCLGHVLRDDGLLRELFQDVAPGDMAVRRALIVALGLLGEPLALETAVPEPDDPEPTEAWLLSVVLSRWLDAAADVRLADRRAEGEARRTTDKALARIESAFPWSVIE